MQVTVLKYTVVPIPAPPSPVGSVNKGKSLSGESIAGIVIGVLIGVILLGVFAWLVASGRLKVGRHAPAPLDNVFAYRIVKFSKSVKTVCILIANPAHTKDGESLEQFRVCCGDYIVYFFPVTETGTREGIFKHRPTNDHVVSKVTFTLMSSVAAVVTDDDDC
jgi:hypothetical protein